MTGAISICAFLALVLFVWLGEPYGQLPMTPVTMAGSLLLFVGSIPLLRAKPLRYQITIQSPRPLQIIVFAFLSIIPVWLIYIVRQYGWPPAFYSLMGEQAPIEILNAQYREKLPFKSLFPPLMIALSVSTVLLTMVRRRFALTLVTLAITFIFVSVYDTRHVILWVLIYVGLAHFLFIQNVIERLKQLSLKTWIGLLLLASLSWSGFVYLGNIRTTISSETSHQFASGMGLVEPYDRLPLSAVWALLYTTSGIARGLVQEKVSEGFALNLPTKLFPGFMQEGFGRDIRLEDIFSGPNFTINAWHSYVLWFGFAGAWIIVFGILFGLHSCRKHMSSALVRGKSLRGFGAAFVLWMWVRATLLPISDYFFDFSAIMELLFLGVFFNIGKVGIEPIQKAKPSTRGNGRTGSYDLQRRTIAQPSNG